MFDKTAVDEYRSLTAPDNLKERVWQTTSKKKRSVTRVLPFVGAIAACLVLLFTTTWLNVRDDVMISSNRNLHSTASVALPADTLSRNRAAHYAAFTLAVKGELELDTDDSLFIVTDSGEFLDTFPYKTANVVSVCWYITSPQATMTVNGVSYTLSADEDNGTFQIVQD